MKNLIKLFFLTIMHTVFSQSIPITGDQYHLYGPNSNWGEYLKVGGNGRETTNASVVSTDGNLHLDSKDGYNAIYLNYYSLGNTYISPQGGFVGIGTTTPSAKLHVDMPVSSADYFLKLGDKMKFRADGVLEWGVTSNQGILSWDTGRAIMGSLANQDLALYANGLEKVRIKSDGNVGIGTTTPSEKLHVNGLIRISSATNEDNNSPGIVSASDEDFLYDNQYINHYAFGFHGFQDGSTAYTEPENTYMSGYFGVDFFTSGENRMRISRDGIVSIGTVNRQVGYKLAVNGNIKAKEIKVETGWSDFVFKSNYKLPTLKEVEQHIKEKGHLKDIPSAEDVKENGIFLGEMDSKLLQKIEELTLYAIEQEKRLESLELKNEELVALVKKLIDKKIEK